MGKFEDAVQTYEEKAAAFTELNKAYNKAANEDSVTDEQELEFFRAQRDLAEAYSQIPQVAPDTSTEEVLEDGTRRPIEPRNPRAVEERESGEE